MRNKTLVSALTVFTLMIFGKNTLALAAESTSIINENGNIIEFEISETVKDEIKIEDFQDVIDELTEDSKIRIHEVVDFSSEENSNLTESKKRAALVPIYTYKTTKKNTATNTVLKDQFVISVARGQTTTLAKEFSGELALSISGTYYDKVSLGLTAKVTAKISATHTFTGPQAPYNSTEYRIKYQGNKGTYTQQKINSYTNKVVGTKSGSFIEPKKYTLYSIDKSVR